MTGPLLSLAIVATALCVLAALIVLSLAVLMIFDAVALRRQLRETRGMKIAHDKKQPRPLKSNGRGQSVWADSTRSIPKKETR